MKKLGADEYVHQYTVVVKAREGMMAVLTVAVVAMSVAEILSRRKRSNPHATSIGCDPEEFRRRLARTLSNIPIPETELLFSGE